MRVFCSLALACASLLLAVSSAYSAPRCRYDLRILSTPARLNADGKKINDVGVVAGTLYERPIYGAFVDDGVHRATFYLPPADDEVTEYYFLSDFVQDGTIIAHHVLSFQTPIHSEISGVSMLSADGRDTPLPPLPEQLQGFYVRKIFPSGAVLTQMRYPEGDSLFFKAKHACIAHPTADGYEVEDLTPDPPLQASYPAAVNDSGDIAIFIEDGTAGPDSIGILSNGVFTPLETQGAAMLSITDLNSSRIAVGSAMPRDAMLRGVSQPMLWRDGRMIRLIDRDGSAQAINDAGMIVGYYAPAGRGYRAFVGDASTTKISDLTGLVCPHRALREGAYLQAAYDINSRGQIVGTLKYRSRQRPNRAIVLTPRTTSGRSAK